MAGLIVVFVFCVYKSISLCTKGIERYKSKYEVKVGQNFILEKDTLVIIDYSLIMENFTLSNGKAVNSSIIFNKKDK